MIQHQAKDLTIEEAVSSIIGEKLAHDIIKDRGLHWAVVAAMCEATTSDGHQGAVDTIRAWNKKRKEESHGR